MTRQAAQQPVIEPYAVVKVFRLEPGLARGETNVPSIGMLGKPWSVPFVRCYCILRARRDNGAASPACTVEIVGRADSACRFRLFPHADLGTFFPSRPDQHRLIRRAWADWPNERDPQCRSEAMAWEKGGKKA